MPHGERACLILRIGRHDCLKPCGPQTVVAIHEREAVPDRDHGDDFGPRKFGFSIFQN
jgi:hypothetical protein